MLNRIVASTLVFALLSVMACGSGESGSGESGSGESSLGSSGFGEGTEGGQASHSESELRGAAAGWNLLVISIDTLRADRLKSFGYELRETSPAIDRMVRSGVRFERAVSQRALTWPALASLLTGLYPSGHGVVLNGYELSPETPTLPKILQQGGYQTAAFLRNMCKAGHSGWDTRECVDTQDSRVLQRVVGWAETIDRQQPFFLWLHYFGPHGPYSNGHQIAGQELDPGYHGPVGPKKWMLDRVMREPIELNDADLTHLDALYDAAIIGTDRYLDQMLQYLETEGLLERTLIVFTSDHGEDLYDHNRYIYHACSIYESGLHVPLAIVAPGLLPTGLAVGAPVELVDVTPTLLDLLGVEPPVALHGRSLLDYLDPSIADPIDRPAFSEIPGTRIRTIVDGNWKLIENPDELLLECYADVPPAFYPIGRYELYDLAADPAELRNLADEEPDKVAELSALLEARFSIIENRGEEQDVPEELKRQLRALGYVAN